MMNTKVVATGLAIVLLGGGLAAGLGAATSGGGSSDTTSDTAKTDDTTIPGMAMGAPPQTVSMNCATDSCDLVFVPPSTETVQPLGLAVQLVKSDATQAVFSVAGKTVTVQPGRSTKAQGATFTLTSPPGAVVNLHISKS
jgi:hypothetical protein